MVSSVLMIVSKSAQILDAGLSVAVVVSDKDRSKADILNAAAQVVFTGLLIGDVAVRNSSSASSKTKATFAYSTAALDGTRFVTHNVAEYIRNKKKWSGVAVTFKIVELAGLILFHVSDIAHVRQLGDYEESHINFCKRIEKICETASLTLALGNSSCRLAFVSIPSARRAYRLYKQKNQPTVRPGKPRDHENGIPMVENEQRNDPIEQEIIKFLASYATSLEVGRGGYVEGLSTIPSFLISTSEVQWNWFCGVTQKPIRFIVVPDFPVEVLDKRPELVNIMYEKSEFDNWITNHPHSKTPPPNWPKEFWNIHHQGRRLVKEERYQQATINTALKKKIDMLYQLYAEEVQIELQRNEQDPDNAGDIKEDR